MTPELSQQSVLFFREAAPYIHSHRDKTFVIAFAGEVVESEQFRALLHDIAIISTLGARLVLVHGTRPQIDDRLSKAGQTPSQFHKGIRITDHHALLAAQEAIGFIRIRIENLLTHALSQPSLSSKSLGIVSGNFITARPLGIHDGVDYGYSGLVRNISRNHLNQQLDAHNMVLLSPIGYSPNGEAYNLRYEQVAIEAAKVLKADKLIFISPQPLTLPHELTADEAQAYLPQYPLLSAIIEAISNQVERVHLLDLATDGALLLELYTRDGVGSMIASEQFEQLRAATEADIGGILELIRPLEERGILVKRSREQLELEINHFHIITRDHEVIACVALHDTADPATAELACLAVNPQYRHGNRGDKLLKHLEQLAKAQGKTRLLVLTTQTVDWFRERGFHKGEVVDLPLNKQSHYNYGRNSQILFKSLINL